MNNTQKDNNNFNLCTLVGKILITPYNWSLIVMTILLWYLTSAISYYSHGNFDMLINLHHYIQLISLGAIIIGLFKADENYMLLAKYGVITYFISLITIILARDILFTTYISHLILKPVSIFLFLMIIKQIWYIASKKTQ